LLSFVVGFVIDNQFNIVLLEYDVVFEKHQNTHITDKSFIFAP